MEINTSIWNAILVASPIVQGTLLLLVILSVLCWAVGWSKHRQLKALMEDNDAFSSRFWAATSLDEVYDDLSRYPRSSLARVFKNAYLELKKLADSPAHNKSSEKSSRPNLTGLDNLERVLRKGIDKEISLMESRLTLLATTGSTAPFIGLFGTVWGIMSSFHKIGATGSASLAVVAPGISEALFATAIGLVAAIPAVVLYNSFIAQIRKQEIELNTFAADFLNILKRNFFKGES
ncbi:MAG: protein TolQ [Bdellovibrionaceae bacterium]|nr:protein TolQ [Pseudobdellovibrionaceae bacterium]